MKKGIAVVCLLNELTITSFNCLSITLINDTQSGPQLSLYTSRKFFNFYLIHHLNEFVSPFTLYLEVKNVQEKSSQKQFDKSNVWFDNLQIEEQQCMSITEIMLLLKLLWVHVAVFFHLSDVGTITLSQYILLDPPLLFFIMAATFASLKFTNTKTR